MASPINEKMQARILAISIRFTKKSGLAMANARKTGIPLLLRDKPSARLFNL